MSHQKSFEALLENSYLGSSPDYLERLYEDYLHDASDIPSEWQPYFKAIASQNSVGPEVSHGAIQAQFLALAQTKTQQSSGGGNPLKARKQAGVVQFVNAFRRYGHRIADLDPLNLRQVSPVPELSLSHHDLSESDLDEKFHTFFVGLPDQATLRDIVSAVKETYAHHIGFEYMHINNTAEMLWLQKRIESHYAKQVYSSEQKIQILKGLTAAEGLEKYLALRYVGQKRFGLEGGESLIPILENLVSRLGALEAKEMVMGMAHRGRLNVLVNILGKSPADLFAEFEGKAEKGPYSGDVKYHKGFSSDVQTPSGPMHLALAFNPSHLEIVSPVVEGSVRARQQRRGDSARDQVLPVIMHGDAAFAGQGVVMETLNLSQLPGFLTGGTIHIVINNQIGYTTSRPEEARSTLYCTDIAKMLEAPVFHVNGDDPEAVIFVTELALDYRMQFHKDVVIDLVCYRRHGHNESDEPSATQPLMYQAIKKHATTRTLYAEKLIAEGVIDPATSKSMSQSYHEKLDRGEQVPQVKTSGFDKRFIIDWNDYSGDTLRTEVSTHISERTFSSLGKKITSLPSGAQLQPQVKKLLAARVAMCAGEQPLDWGCAETLAYASLVAQGHAVRLVGQDAERGTFAHRHAVFHDFNTGECYTPLQHVADKQASFTVINSILSEEAVLAYEYGYATADPKTLVIWEAQFGDFFNGAQMVVDQFISSGEQKWGRMCGLVLFLPHGYEGQGPEHSSARLERFMQLCAQSNMQVCVPSTPAQCFHMLRRQMLRKVRKPLVVMTPKSLLRHKLAVSTVEDLTQSHFQLIIPEIDVLEAKHVTRVVLCSGKVYYDLLEKRRQDKLNHVAILRVEQLYPFPVEELQAALSIYKKAKTVVWCQEEPMNQGAWYCALHWMKRSLNDSQSLHYAGRDSFAAPAVGDPQVHKEQQQQLVTDALSQKF